MPAIFKNWPQYLTKININHRNSEERIQAAEKKNISYSNTTRYMHDFKKNIEQNV
jgi:hypothetical protein